MDAPSAADPEAIRAFLGRNSWFAELPAVLADRLVAAAQRRDFADGGIIHHQGDPPAGLYAVLKGSVKVSSLSTEGRECVFRYLAPASWFGEIGMLDHGARTHDAMAVGETMLLILPPAELARILEDHPIFHRHLALLLCRVVRTAFTMLNDAALLNVPARLAKRLASFAEAYGLSRDGGILISVHLPQDDLAMLVSTTRQTINRRLADWQRRGWIEIRYGKILIRDLAALQRLYREE